MLVFDGCVVTVELALSAERGLKMNYVSGFQRVFLSKCDCNCVSIWHVVSFVGFNVLGIRCVKKDWGLVNMLVCDECLMAIGLTVGCLNVCYLLKGSAVYFCNVMSQVGVWLDWGVNKLSWKIIGCFIKKFVCWLSWLVVF